MSLAAAIDPVLSAGVAEGAVPGVVGAVTDRAGTLYEAGFGERSLGGGVAMTPDTVCWIASMTKAVTGVAAMQLVERGLLDLDVPASRWMPTLDEVRVLEGFDADGVPRLRLPKRPVTLRHLLTHTAGFGYTMWNADIKRYVEWAGLPATNTGELRALMTPLVFDPGERWLYSIGIDWAGKLVEAASGRSLGAWMKAEIFEPLGMASTGFLITPDMRARLARVHDRRDGSLVPGDRELKQDPPAEMGGGGLYSTAGDYLRFVRMILNGGQGPDGRLLRAETVAAMSRNQMGDCRVSLLPTTDARLTLDAEFFPGLEKTWGLSFMINEAAAPTGRSPGSLAWAGLANCFYWIDPASGIGGVFLSQVLPFVDRRVLALNEAFETAVYRELG